MLSNSAWIAADRPKWGPIFDKKVKDKWDFKLQIKHKQKLEKTAVSDSLNEALLNRNSSNFWKMWNSKFPKKRRQAILVG